MIEIHIDTSSLERIAEDLPNRLEAAKTRALKAIGQEVVTRATLAFRTASFRPSPWEPRKKRYVVVVNKKTKKKTKKLDTHPLLIKSGALRQSIFWFKIHGEDSVTIMSDKEYAKYHQHGTKHMPARPFFPVDAYGRLVPAMERKLGKKVVEIYRDELGKPTGGA